MEDAVTVYRAIDEATANIVKIALEDAGIPAFVRPHHTSWLDGSLVPAEGSWGDVVVAPENADAALAVLEEYSRDIPESTEEYES